jgi:hypothetical protein
MAFSERFLFVRPAQSGAGTQDDHDGLIPLVSKDCQDSNRSRGKVEATEAAPFTAG